MQEQTATGGRESWPLSMTLIVIALTAITAVLLLQNSHLKSVNDEHATILDNLSSRIQDVMDENSELAKQNQELQDALEVYQEKVRNYQAELYDLRRQANMTTGNQTYLDTGTTLSLLAPAVKAQTGRDFWGRQVLKGYVGIATNLSLDVVPGKGRVLVNTDPPMGEVFQDTAVTAKETAERVFGTDILTHDLIFSIQAPEEIPSVDGPSAGAAMTLLVLSLLEDRVLNPAISLTGTISSDGSIGAIGHPVEKAEAAEDAGAETFFLSEENRYTRVQYVEEIPWGPVTWKNIRYRNVETQKLIQNRTDLSVIFVDDITELLDAATYKED